MPQLAQVEEGIIAAFKHGGGDPCAQYPRFQPTMAEASGQIVDATLIDVTLKLVPGVTDRLASAAIDVADIACGSGHAINLMAQTFPASRFSGYDFSAEGIAASRADAVHDQAQPRAVLRNIARGPRSGGRFLAVDVRASSHLQEKPGASAGGNVLLDERAALYDRLVVPGWRGPRCPLG